MSKHRPSPPAPEPAPRRRVSRAALTVTLAGGLAVGGGAIAYAAGSTPSPAAGASAPATPGAAGPTGRSHGAGGAGSAQPGPAGKHDRGPGGGGKHGNPAYDSDGRITSVGSGSLTVRDLFGRTRSYALTSATRIHEGHRQQLTATALAAGEHVHVSGQPATSGSGSTLQALDVDVHPAHIDGVVTAVDGSSLTVTDPDGFIRHVTTSGGTSYTRQGSTAAGGVRTGSVIHATGRVDADGTTLDATSIELRVPPTATTGTPGAPTPNGSTTPPVNGS